MRFVLILSSVGLLLLIILVLVTMLQRHLIYFPSHYDERGLGNDDFRPLRYDAGGLLGYVREAKATRRVVLFFHGNGGEAIHREWIKHLLPVESVTIVLAEYPGYGGREGTPSEKAIERAALEIFDLSQKLWSAPVTVLGESLGTGVATFVAARRPVDRLALIAPFTSLVDAAKVHYPFLPVGLLLRERYDSLARVTSVQVPLHVIHGGNDEIVPLDLGRRLFAAYPGADKTMTVLPGIGHNDIAAPIVDDPRAAAFRAFLNEH